MALVSPRFKDDARLQKAAENKPAMKYGEKGEPVRLVQQALIDLGFALPVSTKKYGSPDGIFGLETAAQLRKFQAKHTLTPDGIAGKNSLHKMDELLPNEAPPLPPIPKPIKAKHRVRLHFRSIAVPFVPEFTALAFAQQVYGQYDIDIVMASGQSLALDPLETVKLHTIDGQCKWDQTNDEQKLLFGMGGTQGVNPTDVLVYYVNAIKKDNGDELNGCAGHEPTQPAVVVGSAGSRWTLAHELGHVLLGSKFDPVHMDDDTTNVMHSPTTDITANPPNFNEAQLEAIRKSKCCVVVG